MARPNYSKLYKVPDKEFKLIVKTAQSYSDVLRHCGLLYKGGNINTVKRRIFNLGLDDSCIPKGTNSNKFRTFEHRRISLDYAQEHVFTEHSKYQRSKAKSLIIKFKLIPYRCKCGNRGTWKGKKLSLQLEHKNGIPNDYRIDNLSFLCPNCHSQTDTFAGKHNRKLFTEFNTAEFKSDCKNLSPKEIREKHNLSSQYVLRRICDRLKINRPKYHF